jgi:hypothetical protein
VLEHQGRALIHNLSRAGADPWQTVVAVTWLQQIAGPGLRYWGAGCGIE